MGLFISERIGIGLRVPSHHPETLVKYCSAESAGNILSSQTLRWSAPHLFSDPFELNHKTQLNFDPHSLLQAAIKTATAMIFAKDAPRGNTPLAAAIRRWREEERFASPEEAEDVLKDLLGQMVNQRQTAVDQIMTDWRKFARILRISCFTAKPDNPAAWHQFADSHRGVAIRFQCGEFTSLPKPLQIGYKTARPEITTLKEQLSIIMNNERFVAQEHFYDKLTTKPIFNKDENEWRCFTQSQDDINTQSSDDSQWFDDIKFERGEITSVYFGAYCKPQDKRAIFDIIKEHYPQTKLFQAKTTVGKYEIEFERVTKR